MQENRNFVPVACLDSPGLAATSTNCRVTFSTNMKKSKCHTVPRKTFNPFLWIMFLSCLSFSSDAATNQNRYYGHDAVWDKYGVIAPWYHGLNGQCDYRIRIAAETLKRYPWTTTNNA
ncbi:MAG: Di-glucose binding within endoplasmic reticulum, partial [Pedosphaera sp.]|nr:Di-glucose binding within endoplasmic reticulum [Pedosphaera sp.]